MTSGPDDPNPSDAAPNRDPPPSKPPQKPVSPRGESRGKAAPKRKSSKREDAPPGNGKTRDKPRGPKKAATPKPSPRVSKTDQRRRGNTLLGAPTRLTPEVEGRVLESLTRHMSRSGAFHSAGVSATAGDRWLGWGARYDDGIGPTGSGPRDPTHKIYSDFRRKLLQAEADSERYLLGIVERAASGDLIHTDTDGKQTKLAPEWKASLEVLRRRHRADWADKVEVHTTHEMAEPSADRIADAVLSDPSLAEELNAALGRITSTLEAKAPQRGAKAMKEPKKGEGKA